MYIYSEVYLQGDRNFDVIWWISLQVINSVSTCHRCLSLPITEPDFTLASINWESERVFLFALWLSVLLWSPSCFPPSAKWPIDPGQCLFPILPGLVNKHDYREIFEPTSLFLSLSCFRLNNTKWLSSGADWPRAVSLSHFTLSHQQTRPQGNFWANVSHSFAIVFVSFLFSQSQSDRALEPPDPSVSFLSAPFSSSFDWSLSPQSICHPGENKGNIDILNYGNTEVQIYRFSSFLGFLFLWHNMTYRCNHQMCIINVHLFCL